MRSSFLRILLSLLLLLSQQMAIAHAVSHLADGDQRSRSEKSLPIDSVCEHCLAFAQIGGVLASGANLLLPIALSTTVLVEAVNDTHCRRTVCVFLSRAPPSHA
ncbi:MAG: hypothetical protein V4805_08410 [Pseudomonadota bacterium]